MNKERRIILRTETFERVILRQTSKITNRQTSTLEVHKIEISKVNGGKEEVIFETEVPGLIEIVETDEEIRLVYRNS